MNFLKKIFGGTADYIDQPDIHFGRFSDSYKEEVKYDYWDKSLEKFEENQYLESFKLFLQYLTDDEQGNVRFEESNGILEFEIFQGSKKIIGSADEEKVKAEAKIAESQELKIGFLRRLVELNFGLKYSRYALDPDDNITMLFDTYMLDGSPYKLYYALKELAINADKQDDILMAEFDVLQPINMGHIQNLSEEVKQVKYQFFVNTIKETIRQVSETKVSPDQYPGAISYLLLNGVYKLDYLIKPEGYIMDAFEKIHKIYFRNDNKSAQQKNKEIHRELEELGQRTEEQVKSEMYGVKSTFGITAPTTHERLVTYIEGELKHVDWYVDNKHEDIALAISGYIIGYSMFNYALPAPDREFLQLYYMIFEREYFLNLGYKLDLGSSISLDKSAILKHIDRIAKKHSKEFPQLKPDKKILNFQTPVQFAKSYLQMINKLNLGKEK